MKKNQVNLDEIVKMYSVKSGSVKRRIYLCLGYLFILFAIIGVFIPGWPTVSWAVPAAFMFSYSNKKLFIWSLTNRYFGKSIFKYYATGKTLPKHVKNYVVFIILIMSIISSYLVLKLSTIGNGFIFNCDTWDGKDKYGLGSLTIIIIGLFGIFYVLKKIKTRS